MFGGNEDDDEGCLGIWVFLHRCTILVSLDKP